MIDLSQGLKFIDRPLPLSVRPQVVSPSPSPVTLTNHRSFIATNITSPSDRFNQTYLELSTDIKARDQNRRLKAARMESTLWRMLSDI